MCVAQPDSLDYYNFQMSRFPAVSLVPGMVLVTKQSFERVLRGDEAVGMGSVTC